jgi:phosphoglycerate dehydrogenase-like enzyme
VQKKCVDASQEQTYPNHGATHNAQHHLAAVFSANVGCVLINATLATAPDMIVVFVPTKSSHQTTEEASWCGARQ